MSRELTPEEVIELSYVQPPIQFYIYYEKKTGEIVSVSNELSLQKDFIEVDEATAIPFLNGNIKFIEYVVAYTRNKENKLALGITPVADYLHGLKNKIYEQIVDVTTTDNEFVVIWDSINKQWGFKLNTSIDTDLLKELVFFISLSKNADMLIRTIKIKTEDLTQVVYVPFDTIYEHQIAQLLVSTKLIFGSYGLQIHD